MRERARVGQGGTPIRSRSTFAVLHGGSARSRAPPAAAGRGRWRAACAQTAKPRFQPAHLPPIDARAESPRTWTTVDAHDPGPRNVVVSVVARLGGAGEALPLVAHSRDSPVEWPSALRNREAEPEATYDHELSFSYSSDGGRARRPSSATMTREPTRIRTDRARRRGSRVRPVCTPGPEIRGHKHRHNHARWLPRGPDCGLVAARRSYTPKPEPA